MRCSTESSHEGGNPVPRPPGKDDKGEMQVTPPAANYGHTIDCCTIVDCAGQTGVPQQDQLSQSVPTQ